MTKKQILLILVVLAIAFVLRFYRLGENPPSLNWDEVSIGYNAYSILLTGKDDWGKLYPLANFRAYGDYPLPLYLYLLMPFIVLFGLNETIVRLPSALLGSLTVLVVYFLFREVFKSSKLAIMAAFLYALSPWSILTSRQAIQATPAVFFFSTAILLLIKGMSGKRIILTLGIVFLGISAYAYHHTRILAPVFAALFLFLFKKDFLKSKIKLLITLGLAAIFFLPLIWIIASGEGSARSTWVGILDSGAVNSINEARGASLLPSPLPKLLHNKVTFVIEEATANYLGYFNPWYLGIEGGSQYQFSLPHLGIVYPVELPFFYLGIALLIIRLRKLETEKKLLLGWLLLSPLPAAITKDQYQVVRSSLMLPVFYLLTVFGVGEWLKIFKRLIFQRLFVIFFVLLVILLAGRYLFQLWNVYPKEYSFAWQYGYKEAVSFIRENQNKYQQIVITKKYGEPHEFLLFYSKYDPRSYQEDPNLIRYEKSHWYWVDRFGKFYFVNDWEIAARNFLPSTLLITSPKNYPPNSELIKTIYFLDGKAAFDVVAVKR